jgi:hypothetical protein
MRSSVDGIRRATAFIIMAAIASGSALAQAPQREDQRSSPHGSIKVSGYWNIDVLSPDGSLVSHTEFENALRLEGSWALALLLSGKAAVATLYINLDGPTHPCGTTGGLGCLIVPNRPEFVGPGGPFDGQMFFPTLVANAQTAGSPRLVLTGLAAIPTSGTIGVVQTGVTAVCPPAPAICFSQALFSPAKVPFTEFQLASPIAVQNGQVVTVTVTLSFSS